MSLFKEKAIELIKTYGGSEKNTGHSEVQVALLTERISMLSKHLLGNKKDHSTRRSLLKYVGQRKSLLQYIAKHDILNYRALIDKLNIRK